MTENKNRKILYVATVVKTHIMHFHLPYFEMLKEEGWQVDVAARNDYENPEDCKIPNCDNYYNIEFERNPFSIANIRAYRKLKNIIDNGNYDIVHCHTPVAGVLARLAARNARNRGTKVFYTAHGFHFYKGAPLINWLFYYPVEKISAKYTDFLITINDEDYNLAKDKFTKAGYIEKISGIGFDINKFSNFNKINDAKKKELGLRDNDFVILSVGELVKNKNHIEVLETLVMLPAKYEYKYIVAGDGKYRRELERYILDHNLSDKVVLLGYRNDVAELYKIADLYIMPSKREGLPVSVLEVLASGTRVIASNVRGNRDLVADSNLYELGDAKRLSLLIQSSIDNKLGTKSSKVDLSEFDINKTKERLMKLYERAN